MARDYTVVPTRDGFEIRPHNAKARDWLTRNIDGYDVIAVEVEPDEVVDFVTELRNSGYSVND